MKCFATFGKIGDEYELIAGPNSDYQSQADILKDATVTGSTYDTIHLVDLARGTVKRRKPAKVEAVAPVKKTKKSDQ